MFNSLLCYYYIFNKLPSWISIQAEKKTTHVLILYKWFSEAFKHLHYVNYICISGGFGQILFIILIWTETIFAVFVAEVHVSAGAREHWKPALQNR